MIEGKQLGLGGRVRGKVNSVGRRVGNFVYDGLGDVLVSDISPKRALSVGLVGLAIGGGVGSGGCDAMVGGYVGAKVEEGRDDNSRQINK